jgi:3-hydroxybutyryl-CoA dehydratase
MYAKKSWDEIIEGQSVVIRRTVTMADQVLYGGASGDFGPVHFDRSYTAQLAFGRPIASGIMLSGIFTSILTSHLVGVYPVSIEDRFRFPGPVFFGDTILFKVTVASKRIEDRTIAWTGLATNEDGAPVVEAEAQMKFPRRYMH